MGKLCYFFFQAEDGIRDGTVTGVQTCALPIFVGGVPLAHTNALFTALAVNALNELLGTVGQPGGLHFTPQIPMAGPATSTQTFEKFAATVGAGSQPVGVL